MIPPPGYKEEVDDAAAAINGLPHWCAELLPAFGVYLIFSTLAGLVQVSLISSVTLNFLIIDFFSIFFPLRTFSFAPFLFLAKILPLIRDCCCRNDFKRNTLFMDRVAHLVLYVHGMGKHSDDVMKKRKAGLEKMIRVSRPSLSFALYPMPDSPNTVFGV